MSLGYILLNMSIWGLFST